MMCCQNVMIQAGLAINIIMFAGNKRALARISIIKPLKDLNYEWTKSIETFVKSLPRGMNRQEYDFIAKKFCDELRVLGIYALNSMKRLTVTEKSPKRRPKSGPVSSPAAGKYKPPVNLLLKMPKEPQFKPSMATKVQYLAAKEKKRSSKSRPKEKSKSDSKGKKPQNKFGPDLITLLLIFRRIGIRQHPSRTFVIHVIQNYNKIMQKQMPVIPPLELKHLEKIQVNDSTKRTIVGTSAHLALAKLYLTRQLLAECLETLDIFKEMLEDPVQKNKIIRDVGKALRLIAFGEGAVIYNKGEIASSIYMVIKGHVSLCLPVFKESHEAVSMTNLSDKIEFQYKEIDAFKKGEGFGEAEFIHGRKRALVAKAKQDDTVIGVIDGKDFQEVTELYKQRVYLKKIEMFGKCPLLQNLFAYQLQFIVNNAKPFTFTISKQIVKQEEMSNALYLIMQGQIELRRVNQREQQKLSKYSTKNKTTIQDAVKEKIKIKSIVVGILQEGGFLGDGEIALDTPYDYSAICKSQKVKAYICDARIILSQMNDQNFKSAKQYYLQKKIYRQNKSNIYHQIKQKIQKRIENDQVCILDKNQIRKKRMISNRYVEKTPSLIGMMSPRDIGRIVDKKYSKLKEPLNLDESQVHYFPSIKPGNQMLKADQRAYSPLLKRSQVNQQRKYSQASSPPPHENHQTLSFSHHPRVSTDIDHKPSPPALKSSSLLMPMKPFHRKLESLHERLSREYNSAKKQKRKELDKISAKIESRSEIQVLRMSEFISKIKQAKKG